MTKRRFFFWLLATLFLTTVSHAEAQQPTKIPRIGFVGGDDPSNVEGFRQGLRDLGYIEGKNFLVEYRNHEGKVDRVPGLVA